MGRTTRVGIREQRALNQAMLFAKNFPPQARLEPARLIRALRSALRMPQAELAYRCGLPQAHIARIEAGKIDVRLSTLYQLLDAMFCDFAILPLARVRPSDAVREAHYVWGLERRLGERRLTRNT